jgi:hypothetical protein
MILSLNHDGRFRGSGNRASGHAGRLPTAEHTTAAASCLATKKLDRQQQKKQRNVAKALKKQIATTP